LIDLLEGEDMAEKLTKTAIKDELTRRINYFEDRYGFTTENSVHDMADDPSKCIAYGRYFALYEHSW